jgi:uncharacterized Zn finger protein (UPF0148 family)
MSPYQGAPDVAGRTGKPVGQENWTSIGCMVCHEKHSLELGLYNGSDFNAMDDTDDLCGSCHTMGDAKLGDEPHHSSLEMRTGKGAIGITQFTYMGSVECGDCHAYNSNHSFHPDALACVDCHSTYTGETAQDAIDDTQQKIQALIDAAGTNLTLVEAAKESAEENGTWSTEMNTSYWTAVFNYYFVVNDGSTGAHNPDYAEAALDDANKKLSDIITDVGVLPAIKVSPADGSTNVPVTTEITVKFEKNINFTNFEMNDYITVSGGVSGTLGYDSSTFTVTFTPSQSLSYDTLVTVTLDKGVEYADASPILTEDYTWSFTTESEPKADFKIPIGPILDKDGNPIEGIEITVTIGENVFSGTTNATGYAVVTVPAADFSPGKFDIKLSKDGFDDETFKGDFDEEGKFTPPTSGIPVPKEAEDDGSDTMLVIILIVVIIVVVLVTLMALRKKKPEDEPWDEDDEEDEDLDEDAVAEEFDCPACGTVVPAGELACPECGTEFEAEDDELGGEEAKDESEGEEVGELDDEEIEEAEESKEVEDIPEDEEDLEEPAESDAVEDITEEEEHLADELDLEAEAESDIEEEGGSSEETEE